MKVDELMIGDWVLYDGKPNQIKSLSDDNGCRLSNRLHSVLTYDVKPIPLTYEILESNFGSDEHKLNVDPKYLSYPKKAMIGAQLKPSPDCKKLLEVFNYENSRGAKYECKRPDDVERPFYVHELQHMLKHCDINDEIIL